MRCSTLGQWRDLSTWGDVKMLGSGSSSKFKSILNMLKAFDLSAGQTVVKGITVIET